MDRCPERTPTQPGTKPRGKGGGHGCRRYFGGSWTESSILASPRFSSKSPTFLSVPVRLAPSVSEFAPALEPARCTEVLAWPLLLLAEGSSCSTRQRRCIASTVDRLLPAQASHHAARRRHADGSAYQRERAYAASHYVLWCLATDLGFVR